jgi:hypothetical protein
MSDPASPRHALHLIVEGFPADRLKELTDAPADPAVVTEIFSLTETSAHEALQKIFASDTVAVWGKI